MQRQCRRRIIIQVTSYTTLRPVNCNSCWQAGITDVTSIFIRASFATHHFENFVGDLYVLEGYEPKIPIQFLIYCWKYTGVNNMDCLNLGAEVEV